jgi:hypothetical protein
MSKTLYNIYVFPKDKETFQNTTKKEKRINAEIFHDMITSYVEKTKAEKQEKTAVNI